MAESSARIDVTGRLFRCAAGQESLTSQLRRAAGSVPANIAEGFRRRSRIDKARLMNIAEGSLEEARDYLILANDLSYGHDPTLDSRLDEIGRLLSAYIRSLRAPTS